MTEPDVTAKGGSVAVGGDNLAPIANVKVGDNSTVDIHFSQEVSRKLPSHLGSVISHLAANTKLANDAASPKAVPPEVDDKLKYNQLPAKHPIMRAWTRNSLSLEKAYLGVEQQNSAARFLVRQRAGEIYADELVKKANSANIATGDLRSFARANSIMLVNAVIDRLVLDYKTSKSELVEEEIVRLAVLLVVADAVIECEVLEKPENATAA